MSVTEYLGRKADLAAFQDQPRGSHIALLPALSAEGEGGRIITGIRKLAQWFVLELLTERGSVLYEPTAGTRFMSQLRRGELRTQLDVEQAFASALVDIRRNFRNRETADTPADERLTGAELLSVVHQGDRVSLQIRIDSAAGESREVIFPIRIVPQG